MATGRPELPTGTVTFLRTDVEGSMRLARVLGRAWDSQNDAQLGIVREAVEAHAGVTVRTEGDAVFAVFRDAVAAMGAAIDLQQAMAGHDWPVDGSVRVRVGLHSGEAHLAGDDYGGFDVNRAARIAGVGHGGQIVLSDPTRALIEPALPAGVAVRDLGRHVLKDVPQPERLFQLDVPGLPSDFPPIRSASVTTGNLPSRLTSFLARESELRDLGRLLEVSRLVTITGPGGIGKTSVATELARSHEAAFPDGAWFVPLDVIAEPELVPAAIARALQIYDGPGAPMTERLARSLAARRLLLVLDNFEHLLEAAPLVGDLLRAAPELRIVVTSRAPLHLGGEHEFPLTPLLPADGRGAPGAEDSPAVRLFVERASAVRPGWSGAEDGPIIEDIIRLVDGLPLGIELAAARIALLPATAIRDRLAARLPLPGGGPRDVPARQRTLQATIAWSYEHLAPDQRRLLDALAVFEGSFDVEQVAAMGQPGAERDPLDAVVELADQSLLARSAVSGHSGLGSARFEMLETIRAFALSQLAAGGGEDAVRRGHALALLGLAEAAAGHLPGADQARWLDRLSEDHDNLAAALRWAIDAGEVELAQRLSWGTWRYWQIAGHLRLGRTLADAVVDMPGADEPSEGRMWSLAAAGGLTYWQAETSRAEQLYRAQLETALQIGHRAGEADATYNLAATQSIQGDRTEGWAFLMRARNLYRELGDDVGFNRTDWAVANTTMLSGDAQLALEQMRAARDRFRTNGDTMYEALCSGGLAFIHLTLGNRIEAVRAALESLQLTYAMRDVATTTVTLADAAIVLVDLDRHDDAAMMLAAYQHLCDLLGVRPPAGLGAMIVASRVEERAFKALSSERHAAASERGRQLSLDAAVAFVEEQFEEILATAERGS